MKLLHINSYVNVENHEKPSKSSKKHKYRGWFFTTYILYPPMIWYIISSRTRGGAPLSLQDTRPRQGAAGFPGTPPRRSPRSETDPTWRIIPGSLDLQYSQRNRKIRNHYFKSMLIYFIAGIIFKESMFFICCKMLQV